MSKKEISESTNKTAHAFTLIELLMVISVIAILASMLLPALGKTKALGWKVGCLNNCRSVGQLTAMYTNHFNDYFPYFDDHDKDEAGGGNGYGTSAYNMLARAGLLPFKNGNFLRTGNPTVCPELDKDDNYQILYSGWGWMKMHYYWTMYTGYNAPGYGPYSPKRITTIRRPSVVEIQHDMPRAYALRARAGNTGGLTDIKNISRPINEHTELYNGMPPLPVHGGKQYNMTFADGAARGISVAQYVNDIKPALTLMKWFQ